MRARPESPPNVISMGKKSGRRACRRGSFRRFFRFLFSGGMWSVFLLDWGLAGTGPLGPVHTTMDSLQYKRTWYDHPECLWPPELCSPDVCLFDQTAHLKDSSSWLLGSDSSNTVTVMWQPGGCLSLWQCCTARAGTRGPGALSKSCHNSPCNRSVEALNNAIVNDTNILRFDWCMPMDKCHFIPIESSECSMRRLKYSLWLYSIWKRKVINTLSNGRSDQVAIVENSTHGIFCWSCGTGNTLFWINQLNIDSMAWRLAVEDHSSVWFKRIAWFRTWLWWSLETDTYEWRASVLD